MKKPVIPAIIVIVLSLFIYFILFIGGKPELDETLEYDPVINPENFVPAVTNPYFSLEPGTILNYENKTEEGFEKNTIIVTTGLKKVMGVTATVVWDRVWIDEVLTEETYDWFAQDKDGNVWYLGEKSKEYENGKTAGTEGSWEAGVDGAKPGIIMLAKPKPGDKYRQEYLKGEAEDMGEVVSLQETVTVSFGTFRNCLMTKDWTPLEPGVIEYKYYSPELHAVVLEKSADGEERNELVRVLGAVEHR